MNSSPAPLAFLIHDLHRRGGMERSTYEVARRLSFRWPIEIVSYQTEESELAKNWGEVRFHRVRPPFFIPQLRVPFFIKASWYYFATLPEIWKTRPLIHATGTCSLVSDVIQVQFVHAAWKKKQLTLPPEVVAPPRSGRLAQFYYQSLTDHHISVEKKVYQPHKTYIAISHCVAQELKECFGLTENIHVIHHGVDPKTFHPIQNEKQQTQAQELRASLGLQPQQHISLFVGALDRKGLASTIEALALLPPPLRKNLILLAVGHGNQERFRNQARDRGVEAHLRFSSPTPQIAEFYRMANSFILPTLYEPFGLVILEALASGLPSLVSALAGASELMRDGHDGLLLQNPSDAQEIANQWKVLLENPEQSQAMGRNARLLAEKRDWDQVAKEYEKVLEPLILNKAKKGVVSEE